MLNKMPYHVLMKGKITQLSKIKNKKCNVHRSSWSSTAKNGKNTVRSASHVTKSTNKKLQYIKTAPLCIHIHLGKTRICKR